VASEENPHAVALTAIEGISHKEKKELRKMRFVEGAASNTIEALQKKHEEEERRLARAAKFGIETKETMDIKRQQRAVKFGLQQEDSPTS
jgi:hypothetical protein